MNNPKRPFFSTSLFATIGRAGGLLIPFVVAFYFGAGSQTDAFFLAYGMVVSLAGLFAPVYESILVPYLAEQRVSAGHVSAFCNGVMILTFPVLILLSGGILWGLVPGLTHGSGLDGSTAVLTRRFFLELTPFLAFWVWIAGTTSIFHTHKIFWYPAISPLIRSLTVILVVFFFHSSLGMHAATGGFALGEALRGALGIYLLIKLSLWKPDFKWHETSAKLKEFFGQAVYQLIALLGLNLIPLTDQWFASWLGAGSVSLISYADRLFQIPYQVFLAGFLHIYLSYWSDSYYKDSPEDFWTDMRKDIKKVFWSTVLVTLVLVVIGRPIVVVAFEWARMSKAQAVILADLFALLSLGLVPAVLNLLYVRVLFVLKKSSVFCVQSWIRCLLNVILNYFFMKIWGIRGIALSTACVFIVTTVWLHFYLKKYENTIEKGMS